MKESQEQLRPESTVERFERTLDDIAKVAEEMKRLEPSDHSFQYDSFEESYIQANAHLVGESFEDIADHVRDLAPERDLEHVHSTLGFDRVELQGAPLNLLASEMSAEEFQHWAQVRLPALDEALENGIKPSITLKLFKARVEKAVQRGTETMALSLEDLRFASAYLEHRLKQPETKLRHFNERYRDYAQMLDRCQSREEVIDASSRIRIENASAGLQREQNGQRQDSKSLTALTSKELQMLFTEQSPRHYTSEMIVAKLNYAGDGVSRNAKTEALLKGQIMPGPEARKLVDSLESRMGRNYLDESLSATKHFLQSLKTPNEELRYRNSFDHRELYRRLPPAERDYVYQLATSQKEQLEITGRMSRPDSKIQGYDQPDRAQTNLQVEKLQAAMKEELLVLALSNANPEETKDRTSKMLEEYLGNGKVHSTETEALQLFSRELSEIVSERDNRGMLTSELLQAR